MTRKSKGRTGWHQATQKASKRLCNSTGGAAACIKAAIVTLTLCGLFAVAVADWIISRGGLRDA